ncbi:MAG: hypothetical protein JWO32_746 [Bacteroidetes bacterium]|nr:hypothetical protein [Bacteroidota bacterium]
MLIKEIKKILYYCLLVGMFSCDNLEYNNYKENSIKTIGMPEYQKVFLGLSDTVLHWKINKLFGTLDSNISIDYIDSLLCFNQNGTRFIGCILSQYTNKKVASVADGISFLYGEKIKTNWFFFIGEYIHVPRNLIKNKKVNEQMSYYQLHQIALNEVYSGYLDDKGKINEIWFISHFENNGWGTLKNQAYLDWCFKGKRYTNKKDFYIATHLCKVKANWANINKDSIKPLPQKSLP